MIGMCLERRVGLDAPRRLVAVDDRQLDVHQDQVGLVLGRPWRRPPRRLRPRSSRSRRCPADRAGSGDCPRCPRRPGCVLLMRGLLAAATLTGSVNREGRALAELRTRPRCGRRAARRCACAIDEAEPGAALLARAGAVDLLELLEDLAWSARRDAGAGVAHRRARSSRRRPGASIATSPCVGELDGVADEVEQHLGEPPLVAAAGRQAGRHVDLERQLLARGQRLGRADSTVAPRPSTRVVARAPARAGRPRSWRGRARR